MRIQNLFIVLILGSMQLCMCMRGIINRKQAEKPRPLDAPKVERVLNCVTELPAIGNLQVPRMRAVIEITSAESYNKGEDHNIIALDLRNNQLSQLPLPFNYPNLTEFDCSDNALYQFPLEVLTRTLLARLFLRNNKIKSISSFIGVMENLTVLDLSHNLISALPPEIGNLKKLIHFDVSCNLLAQLPDAIFNMTHLQYLNLCKNSLYSKQIKLLKKNTLQHHNKKIALIIYLYKL